MSIDLTILVTSVVTSLLLGGIILVRNPKSKVNRFFALFSGSLSLWAVCNFIADNGSAGLTLFFTRATFIAGLFIAISAVLLSASFPKGLPSNLWGSRLSIFCFPVVFLVSLTPFMVESAEKVPNAAANIQVGPLYPVFLTYIALALTVFIKNFLLQYRKDSTTLQRSQIRLILIGIALYGVLAIISNLIIPVIVDNWASSRFGPIFALITVALVGYAVVRHKLFDIRLYVVRALAYALSLITIATLYAVLAVVVTTYIFDSPYEPATLVSLTVITLFTAALFQPLKKIFDQVTNRLFYRDAYDAQQFLNTFNKVLVENAQIEKLLNHAAELITINLKASYCSILLDGADAHLGPKKEAIKNLELLKLKWYTEKEGTNLIVTDNLMQGDVVGALTKVDIAILSKLPLGHHEVGFLILGPKKSGNPYSTQDIRVIDTLSRELVLAIQNALHFKEIQRFNRTLQEKVKEATKELRSKNERLRMLDQTKDDFISMASHQLRTPLTSVKGYVSMVLDGDAGKINELQKKLLNQSFLSSQRMVYLISDLLNVSRLRTGKFIIEPIETDLAEVIESEVEQLQETAKGRELTLTYNRPEHFPVLMLDENKLRQVIMNFIDNAIYYTPSGGHITINLVDKPESIEFTVVDDGIGVPKREQHHLFSKFYRAHNAKRTRPDGTGLGLFMAKKVIIAQGGAVIFKSQEGKGSTFGFTFPKRQLLIKDKIPEKAVKKS